MGILQARMLERVVLSFSRGSSRLTDGTRVSGAGRRILYPLIHQGSPKYMRLTCCVVQKKSCVIVQHNIVKQLASKKNFEKNKETDKKWMRSVIEPEKALMAGI